MKTEDLIAALSKTVEPVSTAPIAPRRFALPLVAGLVASVLLLALWLGFGPWERSVNASGFWLKFTYALALGLLGLVLAARLSLPAGKGGRTLPVAVVALVGALILTGARQLMTSPEEVRMAVVLGQSWNLCPFRILAIGAPVYLGAVFAMRSLAPTRPALAGAAAGLLAGGAGAAIYALHCPEYAPAFIAVWYTAGVALCTALGALFGPRLLRW